MPAQKKRRARRPNVPLYTGPVSPTAAPARDIGGGELATPQRAAGPASEISADYTHIINDLKRIGMLAGGFIAILIALSFFIK